MGFITREEAIQRLGLKAVELVEAQNCELTGRITENGSLEFRSSMRFVEHDTEEEVCLEVYYYQDRDKVEAVEDLSDLNWKVAGYQIQ